MGATQARFHISSNHCLDLFADKSLITDTRSLQRNGNYVKHAIQLLQKALPNERIR